MAQKYNKYGAGHKNDFQKNKEKYASKVRQQASSKGQLIGSEMNLPTNQELIDGGWSFLHLNINDKAVGKWFNTEAFKERVEQLKGVDTSIIDSLIRGMIQLTKDHDLLTDNGFQVLSFATHSIEVEQAFYELSLNTKTGEHKLTSMELSAKLMDRVDQLYKDNEAVSL